MSETKGAAPASADEPTPTNDVDLVNMSREELLGLDQPTEQAPAGADEAEAGAEEGEDGEGSESESESESPEGEEEGEGESEEEGEEPGTDDEEGDDEGDEPATEPPKKLTPEEIKALWESHQQLLGLKGRQGQKIGDKDQEIARLQQQLAEARGEKPQEKPAEIEYPKSKEEWDDLYAADPFKAQHLFYQMQREAERKQAEADQMREQTARLQATPFVGTDIFCRENGIADFGKWENTKEGLAVLEIIGGNTTTKLAMLAALNTGNAEAVAEIMSNGLTAVRKGTIHAKGKKIEKADAKKIEAAKPRSVPRPGRRVQPSGRKTLENVSKDDLLNMSDADFRKQFGHLG